ncbi:ABC transporter ATP-binding protein [Eubacteriales bacterium OttesenSCG-928-A19]|nr:ABC transporter ATP-binding protein [Eubacteriales bacterium OttesenSCG-928-A19]
MLMTENLHVYYGAIHAIKGISFEVNQGEIVTLIGANGAGKSTILNTIAGLIRAKEGECRFENENIRGMEAHLILKKGLALVPEGRHIFSRMTVRENLEMGAFARKDKENVERDFEDVFERFPRLRERRRQVGGTLSGGEQQMLATARALMSKPRLLMMDEPSMGLAPILVQEIFTIIQEINAQGTTILLVEQNAKMALSIAHRAYVLETGKVVLSGDARSLLDNEEVKRAYLG